MFVSFYHIRRFVHSISRPSTFLSTSNFLITILQIGHWCYFFKFKLQLCRGHMPRITFKLPCHNKLTSKIFIVQLSNLISADEVLNFPTFYKTLASSVTFNTFFPPLSHWVVIFVVWTGRRSRLNSLTAGNRIVLL